MDRRPLKVVADTSLLRRPHTGVARWVNGLIRSLDDMPDLEVVRARGPRRIGGGPAFRPINLALQRWWYDLGIRRVARRQGADVLLLPGGYAAGPGRLPQLVAILDVNFLTQPGTYDPVFARYMSWVLRRSARDADRILTISAFSRSEIVRHLEVSPERIVVVHPGLEPWIERSTPRPIDSRYALYVGATQRHKNVGLLLDVWPGLHHDLKLVICGQPGRDHAALLERAARLHGRVIVTGRVSEDALEAWYRHADVFMFPSLTEGFGFPPLEAMQRGVPVAAARAGALPEVLGDAASYFDPHDPQSLLEAINALTSDDVLRAELILKGRRQAATYTWPKAAERAARLLMDLSQRA
jgi:glycosyltransferase involved in cell wall biosynthesis